MSTDPPRNTPAPSPVAPRNAAAAARAARLLRVSAENACPYIPGRRERKLWTVVDPHDVDGLRALNRAGFRRSGRILYRPACAGCDACRPARVPTAGFAPSRAQRRATKRNADLALTLAPMIATREHFTLFKRYVGARHADGGMSDMSAEDFEQMIAEAPRSAVLAEWRDAGGALVAACIVDDDGVALSAVYSYFDPDQPKRSLGVFVVLSLIAWARLSDRPHLYLGYVIAETPKMAYKQSYRPSELLVGGRWSPAAAGELGIVSGTPAPIVDADDEEA